MAIAELPVLLNIPQRPPELGRRYLWAGLALGVLVDLWRLAS
jgi:hypothetical protein